MNYPGPVVSAEWLLDHLSAPNVKVFDATVHLPDTGRDAHHEYLQEHIPGAAFFDLNVVADPANPLPRKFPPADVFAREAGNLGIDNQTHVVVYDTPGLYSAARVWWLFRQYGYDHVSVLDGGLKAWKLAGHPVVSGEVRHAATSFTVGECRDQLALWHDVLEISAQRNNGIIDARTAGRFAGTEQDRYPGTRAGHIPNSLHLYWADLLDPTSRTFRNNDALRELFSKAGLDWNQPIAISCGSGLTACILALGLQQCGKEDWKVYDGSWDEWGRRADLPCVGPNDVLP